MLPLFPALLIQSLLYSIVLTIRNNLCFVLLQGCVFCKEKGVDCSEYSETIQELELSGIMESCD